MTAATIATIVAALGLGGVITALANAWIDRRRRATEDQASDLDLVARVKEIVADDIEELPDLRAELANLRRQAGRLGLIAAIFEAELLHQGVDLTRAHRRYKMLVGEDPPPLPDVNGHDD